MSQITIFCFQEKFFFLFSKDISSIFIQSLIVHHLRRRGCLKIPLLSFNTFISDYLLLKHFLLQGPLQGQGGLVMSTARPFKGGLIERFMITTIKI